MKVVDYINEIRDAENIIQQEMKKKENAEANIKIELLGRFSNFRKYLCQKLFENFSEKQKEDVLSEREKREKQIPNVQSASASIDGDKYRYMESASYAISATRVFDPEVDEFQITSYLFNEDNTKLKITVECIKNREYLGISGSWFPDYYITDWLDIKEIEEKENKGDINLLDI